MFVSVICLTWIQNAQSSNFSPLHNETRASGSLFELASTIRILFVFGRMT